jgi:Leucine-rich repeat (LRR) protein
VHLPEELTRIKTLDLLDLGNNYLESLPSSLGNLFALRFLYINHNRLGNIPESIVKCQKLIELDVVRCGAMRMPNGLGDIRSLEYVYIDERIIPFYQNPRNRFIQNIFVVTNDQLLYRRSQ